MSSFQTPFPSISYFTKVTTFVHCDHIYLLRPHGTTGLIFHQTDVEGNSSTFRTKRAEIKIMTQRHPANQEAAEDHRKVCAFRSSDHLFKDKITHSFDINPLNPFPQ